MKLQVDLGIKPEKEEKIRKIIKNRIEDAEYLNEYEFIKDPLHGGWGNRN